MPPTAAALEGYWKATEQLLINPWNPGHITGGSSSGSCDSGYSCAYQRNISWADATTPLPKVVDPRTVFDRLFSGLEGSDPREIEAQGADLEGASSNLASAFGAKGGEAVGGRMGDAAGDGVLSRTMGDGPGPSAEASVRSPRSASCSA